jgi:uncharacterized spore protein YtfJ
VAREPEPVAVIIIHKDVKGPEGVQVLSLKKTSQVSEIISTVGEAVLPQIVGAIKTRGGKKEEGKEIEIKEE